MRPIKHVAKARPLLVGLLILSLTTSGGLFITGCATEPSPITGRTRAYGFSWDAEVQLGRENDVELTRQLGLYDNPQLEAYVVEIGERVLATSDMRSPDTPAMYRDTPFTFRLINSSVVNAFALPGGYVYVTRGLLAHLQNEAQFAVVMGHEIAHVAARHASQQALRAQWGQLGLIAGAILGQEIFGGSVAEGILDLGGSAFQLLLFRYSRDAERESDQLGVNYAAGHNYAVGQAAGFFQSLERIGAEEGRALPTWQSTHPDPGARAQSILQMEAEMRRERPLDVVGHEEYLRRLDGMVLGDDPREGFVRDEVFYHPELAFQFPVPGGWRVQNDTSVVLIADPRQGALMAFQISPARTLQEAASRLANSEGVRVIDSQSIRVGGGLSAVAVFAQVTREGTQAALLNYFIEHGGRIYSFMGYSAPQTFDTYRPIFERSMRAFAPLTDSRILNVQPARIAVIAADRTAPFQSFLPANLPQGITPAGLAIMNQVELNQTIQEGTLLKVPAGADGR